MYYHFGSNFIYDVSTFKLKRYRVILTVLLHIWFENDYQDLRETLQN